ncbi:hypothetical protein K456DRAFT_1368016 [Colletotrichum gloeosporioides 23]|nr:hypothetical protein K456DRAFT_1368016 [Colletotrichum gloeosporioides 23]
MGIAGQRRGVLQGGRAMSPERGWTATATIPIRAPRRCDLDEDPRSLFQRVHPPSLYEHAPQQSRWSRSCAHSRPRSHHYPSQSYFRCSSLAWDVADALPTQQSAAGGWN